MDLPTINKIVEAIVMGLPTINKIVEAIFMGPPTINRIIQVIVYGLQAEPIPCGSVIRGMANINYGRGMANTTNRRAC